MRIYLDEITCPVCGKEHSDHQDHENRLWLPRDLDLCAECEDWADSVKTINPAISQHQAAYYSD